MKTRYIVLLFLFTSGAFCTVKAQKNPVSTVKKETIKVWGECGMCRKKIETAAKNAGATRAEWNEESKTLAVSYNIDDVNASKIQQAVAAAGYDTRDITASDAAYNKLPACCHYTRKTGVAMKATVNCCDNGMICSSSAACCKDGKCGTAGETCRDITACKEKGCCKS